MGDNQFIAIFYARGIKLIIKGDILRKRIAFLYFEAPITFTVFISMQNIWYFLNKIIT